MLQTQRCPKKSGATRSVIAKLRVKTVLCSPDRSQALEEQKRVRHILVASESAIQCVTVYLETGEACRERTPY